MADNSDKGGPITQDWRETLPDTLRFNNSVGKFKTPGDLAQSYIELEKMMGSRVSLPSDTSKEEEFNSFYEKWGRPGKADDFKYPDKLPEGIQLDENFSGSVKSIAHKMGLNQRQFSQLVEWGLEQSQGMMAEQQKQVETTKDALRKEWGFSYTGNIEKAHRALALLVDYKDDHPFLQFLEKSKMGDSPEFMKFLLDFGKRFDEDGFINTKTSPEAVQADDAKMKINEIRADPKHAYWNENDPRHKDAVKEMQKLYEIVTDGK